MATPTQTDRRLQEREFRKRSSSPEEAGSEAAQLPDLAENAVYPSDGSVEELADELEAEKVARDLRIERALAKRPQVGVPPRPLEPLDIE